MRDSQIKTSYVPIFRSRIISCPRTFLTVTRIRYTKHYNEAASFYGVIECRGFDHWFTAQNDYAIGNISNKESRISRNSPPGTVSQEYKP